jgi:hypothetical protein
VPEKSGLKLSFSLTGTPAAVPQVLRRQFFAKGILNKVTAGTPVTLTVAVDATLLARAESAQVKVVLEGVGDGEGLVRVNGTAVKLPDHDWLTEIPIPPSILRPTTELVFATTGDGYQVDVASVVVDAPREGGARTSSRATPAPGVCSLSLENALPGKRALQIHVDPRTGSAVGTALTFTKGTIEGPVDESRTALTGDYTFKLVGRAVGTELIGRVETWRDGRKTKDGTAFMGSFGPVE